PSASPTVRPAGRGAVYVQGRNAPEVKYPAGGNCHFRVGPKAHAIGEYEVIRAALVSNRPVHPAKVHGAEIRIRARGVTGDNFNVIRTVAGSLQCSDVSRAGYQFQLLRGRCQGTATHASEYTTVVILQLTSRTTG